MQKSNTLPTMYTRIRFKAGQCLTCSLTLTTYAELECWYLGTPTYMKNRKSFKKVFNDGTFRLIDHSGHRYIFDRNAISTIEAAIRLPEKFQQ